MVSLKASALMAFVAAAMVSAAPTVQKRAAPGQKDIDVTILNYALTLEHLENNFYQTSLAKFSAKDFENAGYHPWIRQRFVEIGGDEAQHVAFLSSALGDQATKACTYDFGLTDVKSFVATSQVIENLGVSAYLGAAQNITNPSYLTAAGSILTTEARHSSWIQSSASLSDPNANPFDTPASFDQVYSLAAPLIKSCPSSNPKLPVKAFPTLKMSATVLMPGATVKVSGDGVKDGQQVAFLNALNTMFATIKNGQVTVPQIGGGRTYAVVVPGDAKMVSDDNTIAGPVASDLLYSPYKGEQLGEAAMKKTPA